MLLQDGGYTALILASYRGFVEILELLLEHKADVNIQAKVQLWVKRIMTLSLIMCTYLSEFHCMWQVCYNAKIPANKNFIMHDWYITCFAEWIDGIATCVPIFTTSRKG